MEKTEIMFEFDSNSENESLARTVVAAFLQRNVSGNASK